MKKHIGKILYCVILLFSLLRIASILFVSFPQAGDVTIHSSIDSTDVTQPLSGSDAAAVKAIFSWKIYEVFGDGAGCPFGKQLTVTIGDKVFALAQDGCHVVMDAQSQKIFFLSKDEWLRIYNIFKSYDATIPK